MTDQERINELCQQALRCGDWNDTRTERLDPRTRAFHDGEETVIIKPLETAAPVAVEQAPVLEVPQPAAAPARVEAAAKDEELSVLLEEREEKLGKRSKRARVLVNCLVLALFAAPAVTIAVSPSLQAKTVTALGHIREGIEEMGQIGNTKASYDAALTEIGGRGDQIDEATAMLGMDPAGVAADEDLEMAAEMQQFMGDEAAGFQTRRSQLGGMGMVASAVTGMEAGVPGHEIPGAMAGK